MKKKIHRRDFLKMSASAGLAAIVAPACTKGLEGTTDPVSGESTLKVPLTGHGRATDRDITIEPPKETPRYDIIDSHLHMMDFLEDTDGLPALTKAMDMAGVSKAVIFGMPTGRISAYPAASRSRT